MATGISKAARARIVQLADRRAGRIKPEHVVEDARSPTSPLHSYFIWDDRKAAQAQRLETARTLIRGVSAIFHSEVELVRIPAYVRDPALDAGQQGYVSTTVLRDDAALSREALRYEIDRARGAIERARSVAKALNLADEIEQLLAGIDRIVTVVRAAERRTKRRHVRATSKPQQKRG